MYHRVKQHPPASNTDYLLAGKAILLILSDSEIVPGWPYLRPGVTYTKACSPVAELAAILLPRLNDSPRVGEKQLLGGNKLPGEC